MRTNTALVIAAIIAAPAAARAFASPIAIDPAARFCWSENVGWLNWRDTAGAVSGVRVDLINGYLDGFIWSESIGWINAGAGPGPYTNLSGADAGINLDPATGDLSGYAWSENVGWINFGAAAALQRARFDFSARRFRGYAWSENIGWVNLDNASPFVALPPPCPGDVDGDRMVGLADIAVLVGTWNQTIPPAPAAADLDSSGAIGLGDVAAVIAHWGTTCP